MPAPHPLHGTHANQLGDVTIAVLSFGSATAGIVLGVGPLLVAAVALAWPVWALVACRHRAGRGAVVVCLVSGIAAALGTGGPNAWSAVGLLASIDVIAFAGGLVADGMAPVAAARPEIREPTRVSYSRTEPSAIPRSLRDRRRDGARAPAAVERSA
jgi:hypothetical protein